MCPLLPVSFGETLIPIVTVSGERVFRKYLKLNEIIGWRLNPIGLWPYKREKKIFLSFLLFLPCEDTEGRWLSATQ